MKKIVGFMALAAMVFAAGTMLTGCGDKKKSGGSEKAVVSEKSAESAKSSETKKEPEEKYTLVGEWQYPGTSYVYTFNADGTGSYAADLTMKFTYKDDGKSIEITYDGFTESSKYDYSISGNKLTIKDDFGSDVVYERK